MRITKDLLMNFARNTVVERTFRNSDIMCIYLVGSLTREEPLLGGTTDIDLVFVHMDDPPMAREIVPVVDEVHLDLWHYPISVFGQPRNLRTNAWIGSFIAQYALEMYDTQHFFEYTQSGVSSGFFLPSNMHQRAHSFCRGARERWMDMQMQEKSFSSIKLANYLHALYESGNAIACLSGNPLVERRFLLELPACAHTLQKPELYSGLVELFTKPELPGDQWQLWLENWDAAYGLLNDRQDSIPQFHHARKAYYRQAIEVLASDNPQAALWLLLWTWTQIVEQLPARSAEQNVWHEFCAQIDLDRSHFEERLVALDGYLEGVESTLEEYARQNGVY